MIRDAGSRVKQVISYGIASVYTPANHRSKGYARHILQLVHYLIARESLLPVYPETWGPKPDIGPMDADFSVLYSGIGDKYYATCRQGDGPSSKPGWIRLPLTARTWDVSNAQTATSQEGWQWLGLNDLSGLEEEAAQNLRADFDRDTQGDEASSFAILPSWYDVSLLGRDDPTDTPGLCSGSMLFGVSSGRPPRRIPAGHMVSSSLPPNPIHLGRSRLSPILKVPATKPLSASPTCNTQFHLRPS